MARVARVTVSLEIDGQPVRGFPVSRRLLLDETTSFSLDVASGGFTDLPVSAIATKQFFYLTTDQVTTFQFGNGAAGNIQVSPGGFLLLVDGTVATDIEANPSVSAVIDGHVGGT
jgi:hypothetical protein